MKAYRKPPPRVTLHPSEIEAMQCKLVAELPDSSEWQYEMKWDGYRALGSKSAEGAALFSRQQKNEGTGGHRRDSPTRAATASQEGNGHGKDAGGLDGGVVAAGGFRQ